LLSHLLQLLDLLLLSALGFHAARGPEKA